MPKSDRLPSLTVVIPALNEEQVIKSVAEGVLIQVASHFDDYELILVNDGSTDRTGEIMDELAADNARVRVLHNHPNLGLGASYHRGVREARCSHVLMLCGDGGLPAASLPPIFERIGSADIVVPYMWNLKQIKTPTRYFLSRGYTILLNLVFGLRLTYYNGLPVHRLDLLRQIDIVSTGFAFQGEVLVKLLRAGCSYVEVGVEGSPGKAASSALRPRNLVSVATTLLRLLWTMLRDDRTLTVTPAAEALAEPPEAARS
jgi:dolichol-phosphate mannosyltransferase